MLRRVQRHFCKLTSDSDVDRVWHRQELHLEKPDLDPVQSQQVSELELLFLGCLLCKAAWKYFRSVMNISKSTLGVHGMLPENKNGVETVHTKNPVFPFVVF